MSDRRRQEAIREAVRTLAALDVAAASGSSPADATAWRRVGLQRLREGRSAAAVEILDYACLLDPANPAVWELAAIARLVAGRPRAARAAIDISGAIEPTWRRAALAALCREALGDEAGAAASREEARRGASDDASSVASLDRAFGRGEEGA
jgi:hypothetical protein